MNTIILRSQKRFENEAHNVFKEIKEKVNKTA